METDLESTPNIKFTIEQADAICIIGSGIGGGTLAYQLVNAGEKCFTVESGHVNAQVEPEVGGEFTGRPFGIRTTRDIRVGGTSNLWHGVLSPLDDIDFKARSWVEDSGWPITLDDLHKYYSQAANILGPIDTKLYHESNLTTKLKEMLKAVQFNANILKNKIFQQPLPTKNFKNLLPPLVSDNYQIMEGLTALKLRIDQSGKVTGLYVGKPSGDIGLIIAKKFVISTGALESPRLLLNSDIKNINIGKYLMDHPMGNLFQIKFPEKLRAHIYSDYKFKDNCKIKTGLVFSEEIQKKYKLLNHCFYFRPSFVRGIDNRSEKIKLSLLAFKDGGVTFKDVVNLILNLNVVAQILIYKFSLNVKYKYADIFCVTEQKPSSDSFVTLSETRDKFGFRKAKINWTVSDKEERDMNQLYEILKKEGLANYGYEFTHELSDLSWSKNYSSAAHHVGTCRMANSENNGVVDENLKVFGLDNLYICDGSVFPTSGNVNSSFTISALACRLAEYLTEKE